MPTTATTTPLERARQLAALSGRASRLSAAKRTEKARWRQALATGATTLADVLEQRPTCLEGTMLFDLIGMAAGIGPRNVTTINRRAVLDGINLAVTLEAASARTREWVAENAYPTNW